MSTQIPNPEDATEAELAEHLEGRPIRYHHPGTCKRCRDKNSLRMRYTDADYDDLADESFEEQERIRFVAFYDESPPRQGFNWRVGALYHERHSHPSQAAIALPEQAQVMATATLVRAEEATTVSRFPDDEHGYNDELVLADVTVEFYSSPSEGEDGTPPEQEGTVIATGIGDRKDWPEEENEWRKKLIRESENEQD